MNGGESRNYYIRAYCNNARIQWRGRGTGIVDQTHETKTPVVIPSNLHINKYLRLRKYCFAPYLDEIMGENDCERHLGTSVISGMFEDYHEEREG